MKYTLIGTLIMLMSCAPLGSKTKIYNDTRIKDIQTVGLITKSLDERRNPYHTIIKEAFTRTLIEGLEKKNLFRVIILDTMENEKLEIKTYTAVAAVDALLLAEWDLAHPNNMVSDAKVKLSLLDKETKEVFLISKHNTLFGNSYWMIPILPKTLIDATEGALRTFAKNINSRK